MSHSLVFFTFPTQKSEAPPELPPNGDIKNLARFELREISSDLLIGLIEYYNGFPENEDIFIGHLYISRMYQNKGFRKLVIGNLVNNARESGIRKLYLNVATKNYPALWFWYNNGFNKIGRLIGDKDGGSDKYLDIQLINEIA